MSNLKLITTEHFGDIPCNFYRNVNDDILLTREQIGQALGYADPIKAIQKIHTKHKDRLDKLSIRIKTETFDVPQSGVGRNLLTERVYYTERGVMEICRWSRQEAANRFMDWVWDIVESYRTWNLSTNLDNIVKELTKSISVLTNTVSLMQQDISTLKESQQKKLLPEKKYSRWKSNMFKKLNMITQFTNEHSDQDLNLRNTIHIIIKEVEKTYEIDVNDYTEAYKLEFSLDVNPYPLDVINHYKEIRDMYTLTVNNIMENLNLSIDTNAEKNIFDILTEQIKAS